MSYCVKNYQMHLAAHCLNMSNKEKNKQGLFVFADYPYTENVADVDIAWSCMVSENPNQALIDTLKRYSQYIFTV